MAPEKENVEEREKPEGEVAEDSGEAEAVKEGEKEEEREKEGGNEKVDEGEQEGDLVEDDEDEDDEGGRSVKKRSRKEKEGDTGDVKSPRTPLSVRPARERKIVERFMSETPKSSGNRPISIEKGRGTQLKDIPNVAFKLSKRKPDENLKLLHTILFGKKSKVLTLKKNIGLFSGFAWVETEQEKQRAKIKEKIERCVKDKLLDFCDLLNISVHKSSTKKEELSAKLLEFLESPHATTDTLLAEKEKGKKRKRKSKASVSKSQRSSNVTAGKSSKKQMEDSESRKKQKHSNEEDDNKSEPSQSEDDYDNASTVPDVESEQEDIDSEGKTDEDEPTSKTSAKKDSKTGAKSKYVSNDSPAKASKTGKSTKKSSRTSDTEAESESESKSRKVHTTKKQKVQEQSEKDTKVPTKDASSNKKKSSKSSTEFSEEDQGETNSSKVEKPSREEMHAVVVDMLKEADFNTATMSDILKQLGKHFGRDLMHRKSEVKEIITQVINNMTDDEDDEEADSGDDEKAASGDDEA